MLRYHYKYNKSRFKIGRITCMIVLYWTGQKRAQGIIDNPTF